MVVVVFLFFQIIQHLEDIWVWVCCVVFLLFFFFFKATVEATNFVNTSHLS